MALTITIPDRGRTVVGNRRLVTGSLTQDSSYPTGGESLTPGDLGLSDIDFIVFSADVIQCYWESSTKKVLMYYGNNDGAADGEFVEATSTDDLSAANIDFQAWGR